MRSKLVVVAVVGAGLLAIAAGSSAAVSHHATLVIHHQTRGCHSWALNGGRSQVSQVIHLSKGGSLTVTNNDVMSHQLIKLAGSAVAIKLVNAGSASSGKLKPPYAVGLMPHIGATIRVSFSKPGTYKFTTKEGKDYYPGITTTGPDNILHATVIVSG